MEKDQNLVSYEKTLHDLTPLTFSWTFFTSLSFSKKKENWFSYDVYSILQKRTGKKTLSIFMYFL